MAAITGPDWAVGAASEGKIGYNVNSFAFDGRVDNFQSSANY